MHPANSRNLTLSNLRRQSTRHVHNPPLTQTFIQCGFESKVADVPMTSRLDSCLGGLREGRKHGLGQIASSSQDQKAFNVCRYLTLIATTDAAARGLNGTVVGRHERRPGGKTFASMASFGAERQFATDSYRPKAVSRQQSADRQGHVYLHCKI